MRYLGKESDSRVSSCVQRPQSLQVRPSSVQGRGVFAAADIEEGTILGAYPGIPRPATDMSAKCAMAPLARYYCFRNKRGLLLDPTDWTGAPAPRPQPGLPWFPVDVTLSCINEPPKRSPGVNVTVEDDPKDDEGLIFVAAAPIRAGSELFVDYGLDYDRSSYGANQEEDMEWEPEVGGQLSTKQAGMRSAGKG